MIERWIILHYYNSSSPTRIRPETIIAYRYSAKYDYTLVYLICGNVLEIRENPEEIETILTMEDPDEPEPPSEK